MYNVETIHALQFAQLNPNKTIVKLRYFALSTRIDAKVVNNGKHGANTKNTIKKSAFGDFLH